MTSKIQLPSALTTELNSLEPGNVLVFRAASSKSISQDYAILAHDDLLHILELAGMKTRKPVFP